MSKSPPNRRNIKLISIILFDLLLIGGLVIYFGLIRPHVELKIHGTYMTPPVEIEHFQLTDHNGKIMTKKQLQGHWTMVFFGFTHCPMICPSTMAVLNQMHQYLPKDLPAAQQPQVLLISVDPARDNVSRLKQFIQQVNPKFSAARAEEQDIIKLEKQLHLTVPKDNLTNHSMEIVLINPEAKVQAYFSYPANPQQLAADFILILNHFLKNQPVARISAA